MFPLVGATIGAVIGALAWGFAFIFPQPVTAILLVVVMWGISGGLHMDGLSDTADGFFSSRPKQRILEIMKDSRVGAMGVVAIVFALLCKVVCLGSLDGQLLWRSAALAVLTGRCAMLIGMVILPSANPDSGLGAMFLQKRFWWEAILAAVVAGGGGFVLLGFAGLISVAIALAVVLLFSLKCYRTIGGATGDTMGACCELAETALLLASTAHVFPALSAGALI